MILRRLLDLQPSELKPHLVLPPADDRQCGGVIVPQAVVLPSFVPPGMLDSDLPLVNRRPL
jgi:hypothetical protein